MKRRRLFSSLTAAGLVLLVDAAALTVAVRHGIRPICQAGRLLDPDPLVRAMAEGALLVRARPVLLI